MSDFDEDANTTELGDRIRVVYGLAKRPTKRRVPMPLPVQAVPESWKPLLVAALVAISSGICAAIVDRLLGPSLLGFAITYAAGTTTALLIFNYRLTP